MSPDLNPVSRRLLLGATALGGASSVIGLATPAQAALASHNEIGGARLYYDPNLTGTGAYTWSGNFETTFYSRLEAWWSHFYSNTPGYWTTPAKIYHVGVYANKDGAHSQSRAIDLTRIKMNDSNGSPNEFTAANFNEKQFKTWGTPSVWYRRYWAAVAGLNRYFAYVLHCEYNAAHEDHVHVDNMQSGGGSSTFSTGSRAQVTFVQASLGKVWGKSVSVDGVWGSQTSNAAKSVLEGSLGRTGTITTSTGNWHSYCTGTMVKGAY
jgi:hypothetical protein